MTRRLTRWALAALALALPLTGMPRQAGAQASAIDAEAYGVYVKTLTALKEKAPYAALPDGAVMADDQALSVDVPGVIDTEDLFATVTGAGDLHDSAAQSHATLGRVSILEGLITADAVVAMATSAIHGTTVESNADGSTFANLVVSGVLIAPEVAPNTRISLPGVGYVVLNAQSPSGDGVSSTGLTVQMIHVVLQDALTGAKTGDIVVGSARSYVAT